MGCVLGACLGLTELLDTIFVSQKICFSSILLNGIFQGFPNQEISRDARVHVWIESYRELLDTWQMWHQRFVWVTHEISSSVPSGHA